MVVSAHLNHFCDQRTTLHSAGRPSLVDSFYFERHISILRLSRRIYRCRCGCAVLHNIHGGTNCHFLYIIFYISSRSAYQRGSPLFNYSRFIYGCFARKSTHSSFTPKRKLGICLGSWYWFDLHPTCHRLLLLAALSYSIRVAFDRSIIWFGEPCHQLKRKHPHTTRSTRTGNCHCTMLGIVSFYSLR